MTELLPCPFCGSSAMLHHDDSSDYERQWTYSVECGSGECSGSAGHYATKEQAIQQWNQRQPVVNFDLEFTFHSWLVDYETTVTQRWDQLMPPEWNILIQAQWEIFRNELFRVSAPTRENES